MTRIRYIVKDGVLESKPLLANTLVVVAKIDTVANTYTLVDTGSGRTLASGTSTDLAMAKKMVKQIAGSIGVVFQDEVRRRNAN